MNITDFWHEPLEIATADFPLCGIPTEDTPHTLNPPRAPNKDVINHCAKSAPLKIVNYKVLS